MGWDLGLRLHEVVNELFFKLRLPPFSYGGAPCAPIYTPETTALGGGVVSWDAPSRPLTRRGARAALLDAPALLAAGAPRSPAGLGGGGGDFRGASRARGSLRSGLLMYAAARGHHAGVVLPG